MLIAHPASSGEGLNLIASNVAIFYSRSFSLGHAIQSEARNFRSGSAIHEKVLHINLVASSTIDEYIQEKLADKVKIGEAVLKDIAAAL